MNSIKIPTVTLYMIILFAFTPKRKSIIGLYGSCPRGYFSCRQLELKEDSTFNYFIFYDVGGGTTKKGTWRTNRDTLILNTYNQPKFTRGYNILDSTHSITKEIHCFNRDGLSLFRGTVIINKSDTLKLDFEGRTIYKGEIKNIDILGYKTHRRNFVLKDTNYSKIDFFVDHFACHNPHYLTDERLIIDRNEIKPYLHCHGKYANEGLKKTSLKNKRFK